MLGAPTNSTDPQLIIDQFQCVVEVCKASAKQHNISVWYSEYEPELLRYISNIKDKCPTSPNTERCIKYNKTDFNIHFYTYTYELKDTDRKHIADELKKETLDKCNFKNEIN